MLYEKKKKLGREKTEGNPQNADEESLRQDLESGVPTGWPCPPCPSKVRTGPAVKLLKALLFLGNNTW